MAKLLSLLSILAVQILLAQASILPNLGTTFRLYKKDDPKTGLVLDKDHLISDIASDVKEIVFIVHGWMDSSNADWYGELKDAYFNRTDGDYLVIYVDWSFGAAQLYPASLLAIRGVAKDIANLLSELKSNSSLDLSKVNVVGHSLGAQIGGFVGKEIYKDLKEKIGKITGLDPAGPGFTLLTPDDGRLIKTDATLVLVIHTDGGDYGYMGVCGTIDVYPNGGTAPQPGCPDLTDLVDCAHKRSYRFFIEAISIKDSLVATECGSYADFKNGKCKDNKKIDIGADLTEADAGVYYMQTNPKKPFGKGA